MAIVIGPAMSMQASGNLGDINYTRWKGVSVARTTYVYSDPNTVKQQLQRGKLEFLALAWGALLDDMNRETWKERAAEQVFINRLGGKYRPSGYQLYMKWNLQLAVIGVAMNNNAPAGVEGYNINRMYIIPTGGGKANIKLLDYGDLTTLFEANVFFRAGPYNSGGRKPIKPEYRLAGVERPPATFKDEGLTPNKFYWYKGFGVYKSGIRSNEFEVHSKIT